MKVTGHIEKWRVGVLGAVSLVLVVHLVLKYKGGRMGKHAGPCQGEHCAKP
jgi:hypothetical protein